MKTEVEESKSPDTAIALYQKKYQEERQQKEQHAETIRAQAKTQEQLLEQDKEKSRTITQQNEMIHTKDEKISSLKAANLAQQERIAALEAMLDKSSGHKAMSNNIDR